MSSKLLFASISTLTTSQKGRGLQRLWCFFRFVIGETSPLHSLTCPGTLVTFAPTPLVIH